MHAVSRTCIRFLVLSVSGICLLCCSGCGVILGAALSAGMAYGISQASK